VGVVGTKFCCDRTNAATKETSSDKCQPDTSSEIRVQSPAGAPAISFWEWIKNNILKILGGVIIFALLIAAWKYLFCKVKTETIERDSMRDLEAGLAELAVDHAERFSKFKHFKQLHRR